MEVHPLIIIGSGPAGYTAALYAARAKLSPLLFAGEQAGGQLMFTTVIENFPGFPEGIYGAELMGNMLQQAEKFGATVKYQNVSRVDFSEEKIKKIYVMTKGQEVEYHASAVIIATGAESIFLGIPGESKLLGKGVATCAVCDAAFYKDKVTYVVGGGDSAMEDTLALTKFAKSVTVIHRRDAFRASKVMAERVLNHPKVNVLWNTVVKEVRGEAKVQEIVVDQAGEEKTLPADGFFLAIGHHPTTSFLKDHIELDSHGYIVTGMSVSQLGIALAQQRVNPEGLLQFPTMTSVSGVFAAGDVVDVRYKQAITAAGQGCAAAIDVEKWLERQV